MLVLTCKEPVLTTKQLVLTINFKKYYKLLGLSTKPKTVYLTLNQ